MSSKVKTVTQVKHDQPCDNKRQALSQIKRIDWNSLEFRTPNQKSFYHTISRNDVTFSIGPAGCGKTFLAIHYALKNLAKGKYDKLVITKPLVEVDGEKYTVKHPIFQLVEHLIQIHTPKKESFFDKIKSYLVVEESSIPILSIDIKAYWLFVERMDKR